MYVQRRETIMPFLLRNVAKNQRTCNRELERIRCNNPCAVSQLHQRVTAGMPNYEKKTPEKDTNDVEDRSMWRAAVAGPTALFGPYRLDRLAGHNPISRRRRIQHRHDDRHHRRVIN